HRIDLSVPKYLCETTGGTYDQDAVQLVAAVERLVGRRHGHFGAVLNAIEYMVEDCSANPRVISHLCDALVTLGEVHRLAPPTMTKLHDLLCRIQHHLDATARR